MFAFINDVLNVCFKLHPTRISFPKTVEKGLQERGLLPRNEGLKCLFSRHFSSGKSSNIGFWEH